MLSNTWFTQWLIQLSPQNCRIAGSNLENIRIHYLRVAYTSLARLKHYSMKYNIINPFKEQFFTLLPKDVTRDISLHSTQQSFIVGGDSTIGELW